MILFIFWKKYIKAFLKCMLPIIKMILKFSRASFDFSQKFEGSLGIFSIFFVILHDNEFILVTYIFFTAHRRNQTSTFIP